VPPSPGFPNCYLVHGPNIGLGHTSVIHMFESQANYIAAAVTYARDHDLAAVEPTTVARQTYAAEVDELGAGSVWTTGGCKSWYLNGNGRNTNIWPGATIDFRRRTLHFEPDQAPRPPDPRARVCGAHEPVTWAAIVAAGSPISNPLRSSRVPLQRRMHFHRPSSSDQGLGVSAVVTPTCAGCDRAVCRRADAGRCLEPATPPAGAVPSSGAGRDNIGDRIYAGKSCREVVGQCVPPCYLGGRNEAHHGLAPIV
jgi:hypothetical protein